MVFGYVRYTFALGRVDLQHVCDAHWCDGLCVVGSMCHHRIQGVEPLDQIVHKVMMYVNVIIM